MARYIDTLKRVVEGDYANATDAERDQAVAEVKKVGSAAAAAVAIQPLPLVDVALVSPIQILMVQGIARVRGFKIDRQSAIEILTTFGASILAQNAILAAAKFVPFAGWLLSISMAYALTYALAEVSDYYFSTGRGASKDELKKMFNRIYKEKRAEKEAQHKQNASLKDKLNQLKDAYKSGLLTEEQYEKKKEDLLSSF